MAVTNCALCLRDLPIFEGIEIKSFEDICSETTKKVFQKGELIFSQGNPADTIFLIKEGSIKLAQVTEDGREVILGILGKGDIVGESALFQRREHLASAIALEESKVCSISHKQMEKLIMDHPLLAMQLITNLGKKFYSVMEQKSELYSQTVEQRVLKLFVRLAREYGQPVSEGCLIPLKLTQQDIANMLGVSRVTVVQVLKELRKANRLDKQGKYYVLRDRCF